MMSQNFSADGNGRVSLSELDELMGLAETFLQCEARALDYQKAVDDAVRLSGSKFGALNLYTDDGLSFSTVAVSGKSSMIRHAERLLGFPLVGKVWENDPRRAERIRHGTITRFPRLSELSANVLPPALVDRIAGLFGIGETLLVRIMQGGGMIGDLTLFMAAGEHFRQHRMLEAYSRLLGLALARRRTEDTLLMERRRMENIIDSAELGTWEWDMVTDAMVINERWAEMLGYTVAELAPDSMQTWRRLVHPEDRVRSREQLQELFARRADQYSVEIRMRHKDGSWVWMLTQGNVIEWSDEGKPLRMAGVHVDISGRKLAAEALKASEDRYSALVDKMPLGLAVHEIVLDDGGKPVDYVFLDANPQFEKFTGLKPNHVIGRRMLEIMPNLEPEWIERYGHVALTGESIQFESRVESLGRHYEVTAYSPSPGQFATVFNDVSERYLSQERIDYLDSRDYLTGVYNRKSFETRLNRLDNSEHWPLSIVIADVNGLKLINDSFGWKTGDELLRRVAQVLLFGSRPGDVVARLGGDEFALVMPNTDAETVRQAVERMREQAQQERIDGLELSISFGYETKLDDSVSVEQMIRVSEDYMNRRKVYEQSSMRNRTIDLIMNTLFAKSQREAGHSARVGDLCGELGEAMGLDSDASKQLRLAGLMHDIGKIGVREDVLNKEGTLDEVEWWIMRMHPEIGYRILSASDEFSDIAQYVLEHQERWDGTGYPKGLKGEEISLPARIIAVVDAFDAMTSERTYRKALSTAEAMDELRFGAGGQFDPAIVQVMIDLLSR